jgi:hypothetical protein
LRRAPQTVVSAESYGIKRMTRQNGLARCKSFAFMASAAIVALPLGVRPISRVPL